jgi:hypothetical protein
VRIHIITLVVHGEMRMESGLTQSLLPADMRARLAEILPAGRVVLFAPRASLPPCYSASRGSHRIEDFRRCCGLPPAPRRTSSTRPSSGGRRSAIRNSPAPR